MFRFKIVISIIIFSLFLVGTSTIKNETREIEKKIYNLSKKIIQKEEDLNESQLDFTYLTSPFMIEQTIEHLDKNNYIPMEYSRIFLNISSFIDLQNKFAIKKNLNEKKTKKK